MWRSGYVIWIEAGLQTNFDKTTAITTRDLYKAKVIITMRDLCILRTHSISIPYNSCYPYDQGSVSFVVKCSKRTNFTLQKIARRLQSFLIPGFESLPYCFAKKKLYVIESKRAINKATP